MDYKSIFTNLCLDLQQNRSWIKGLGKNPFTHSIPFTHSLTAVPFVRGTEVCSLGLRETPACIHVIQRLSQPRVACWHDFRHDSQKTECVFTRCPTCGRKKIACIHGLRSEGVNNAFRFLRVLPVAVSTRHSWLWQTWDDVYTRSCFSESEGTRFGAPGQKALPSMNEFTLLWSFA